MSDRHDDMYSEEVFDDFDEVIDDGAASPYGDFATDSLLISIRDIIESAAKVPLSASAMVPRDEVLSLLDEAIDRLPEEIRAARWLLKERDEFLTKVRHEGEEIINQARARAEQLVQRTEVIKAAEQRAWEVVDHAEADARRLRHEVEDFCDQKLASFEIILERTMAMVGSGRAKLQGTNLTAGIPVDEVDGNGAEVGAVADEDDALAWEDSEDRTFADEWDDSEAEAAEVEDQRRFEHLPPPPSSGSW